MGERVLFNWTKRFNKYCEGFTLSSSQGRVSIAGCSIEQILLRFLIHLLADFQVRSSDFDDPSAISQLAEVGNKALHKVNFRPKGETGTYFHLRSDRYENYSPLKILKNMTEMPHLKPVAFDMHPCHGVQVQLLLCMN